VTYQSCAGQQLAGQMPWEGMKSEGRLVELPTGYAAVLTELKDQIRKARIKAGLAVNRELVLLYWRVERQILRQQQEEGWGSKVIDRQSFNLRREFLEMKGFSSRNLKYIRAFFESYPYEAIVQQFAAQIPWFHNCVLLDKVKCPDERIWYFARTSPGDGAGACWFTRSKAAFTGCRGRALVNFDLIREKLR
jgi:predicted nuclease of restriction endonuclease-like (RecB) superfamily